MDLAQDDHCLPTSVRWLARAAVAARCASSVAIMAVGLLGPSAAVVRFPSAAPWPPYFWHAGPSDVVISLIIWAAVLLGGSGVVAGLLATRRGWRPRPRRLLIGSAVAVIAMLLMPPIGSTDVLDYAAYGRIAALGHSPYVMTPAQLRSSGDPVGLAAPHTWQHNPSAYGPIATVTERAASQLAGDSAARTVFWIKIWNALAYLSVALALDRLLRSDAALRVRAHLLWSVNPLMLFAVIEAGHVDGLGVGAGLAGLLAMRRVDAVHGLLAGALVGVAVAVKAPFALFGGGLCWAARRSPLTLAALALGAAAVLVPSYLLAGPGAVSAVTNAAHGAVDLYQPWQLLSRMLHWHPVSPRTDAVALVASLLLGVVLLWRLPAGPPGLPAIRPALALTLAWLIPAPQQRPWFDAMIFPLLAVMPATRLDWIAIVRAAAATAAELPGARYYRGLRPYWLYRIADLLSRGLVPLTLWVTAAAALWLCVSGRWTSPAGPDGPAAVPRPGQPQPSSAAGSSRPP